MRCLALLLLIAGCATVNMAAREPIPVELTTCPDDPTTATRLPAPLPKLRTVETVLAHDAAQDRALQVSEAKREVAERDRAACAETLRKLVEWEREH